MPRWNRFDICESWYAFAMETHGGQWTKEYETFGRLGRMHFRPSLSVRERGYDGLTENGKEIYDSPVERRGQPRTTDRIAALNDRLRRYGVGGQIVATRSVVEDERFEGILDAVRGFEFHGVVGCGRSCFMTPLRSRHVPPWRPRWQGLARPFSWRRVLPSWL
jgi:hypothetical protein